MGNRLSTKSQAELKEALVVALKTVGKGLDGLPIPGVQGCVTGILDIIDQEELRKANEEAFKGLLAEIGAIQSVTKERISEELGEANIPDQLRKDIAGLASSLNEIPKKYQPRIGSPSWRRNIKNFVFASGHAKILNSLANELEQALRLFSIASSANIQVELQRLKLAEERRKVEEDKRRIDDDKRWLDEEKRRINEQKRAEEQRRKDERQRDTDRLIDKLWESKYVQSDAFWKSERQGCAEGTRVSVVDAVSKWATESNQPPLMWMSGMAGTGKSTIAQTLAQKFNEESTLGAAFMFSEPNGVTDGSKVFASLSYQLALHIPAFKDRLVDSLKVNEDSISASIPRQFETLLATPLSQLPSTQPPTVIIIDALDECSPQSLAQVMSCILGSIARFTFLRILVISRPEHPIWKVHQPFPPHVYSFDLGLYSAHSDIQLYLQKELNAQYHLRKPSVSPDVIWPPVDKLESLSALADGLFIFASTAARFIVDDKAGDPETRLETILAGQHRGESNPFSPLDRMYQGILGHALQDSDVRIRERFQDVVGAVVFADDPLSINSLVQLHRASECQYDADAVRTALKYLHSVIVIPDKDHAKDIRVYHSSFMEFIAEPTRCTQEGAYLSPFIQHQRLFRLHAEATISALEPYVKDLAQVRSETIGEICWSYLVPCNHHLVALNDSNSNNRSAEGSWDAIQGAALKMLPILTALVSEFKQRPADFGRHFARPYYRGVLEELQEQVTVLAHKAGLHVHEGNVEEDSSSEVVEYFT